MLIKTIANWQLKENNVTDETVYKNRRQLLKSMGYIGTGALLAMSHKANALSLFGQNDKAMTTQVLKPLSFENTLSSNDTLTPEAKVTSYNNFYEFGTDKTDPAENAGGFNTDPWVLEVGGMVNNPLTLDYDDLTKQYPLEERIYRLRCVEAWSMVIPWIGFPLAKLIADAKPTSQAKYVAFETLFDPQQMPDQRRSVLGSGIQYPYVEGLRLDEAVHPLTLMAVGLYGKTLPNQNGAPIRLVVPWKYGFKSIKSIVKITLTDKPPPTTWNIAAPQEYGFYANVNPAVAHPRWSQAMERRITSGGLFNQQRIPTQAFNGYADEVGRLYQGMDLTKYF